VGCAEQSATTPDLDTVPTEAPLRVASPPSQAFYDAWKGTGSQVGQFQARGTPRTTVSVQTPPQVFAPPAQMIPNVPLVQVEPLDSLPKDVEDKIDSIGEPDEAGTEGEPASAKQMQTRQGTGLIAQMQSLAEQVKQAGNMETNSNKLEAQMQAIKSASSTRMQNPWQAFSQFDHN